MATKRVARVSVSEQTICQFVNGIVNKQYAEAKKSLQSVVTEKVKSLVRKQLKKENEAHED